MTEIQHQFELDYYLWISVLGVKMIPQNRSVDLPNAFDISSGQPEQRRSKTILILALRLLHFPHVTFQSNMSTWKWRGGRSWMLLEIVREMRIWVGAKDGGKCCSELNPSLYVILRHILSFHFSDISINCSELMKGWMVMYVVIDR